MADCCKGEQEGERQMGGEDIADAAKVVLETIAPLRTGEMSEKLGKVSVYIQSAAKSKDAKQASNFIRFARLNLDASLAIALESAVFRPRLASKSDEQKKAAALKKTFDRIDSPGQAMLEHYTSSSDPLNKYLVAGPWGHEYLKTRGVDLEDYDRMLCEILGCEDSLAGRMMQSYAHIRRAIDEVERRAKARGGR